MFEIENPFKYGPIVTGRDFVDREPELSELINEIRSGKSIVVYSNRRMGKSSLLAELTRRHQKEFIFVTVDLYGTTDRTQFLQAIVREVGKSAFGRMEKLAAGFVDIIRSAGLRYVLTGSGELGVEFTDKEPRAHEASEILDLPQKIAAKKGKRIVVIFDEFQEIASLDGVSLLRLMRSRFQTHGSSVYIFSGSRRHLLHHIFEEREGAFFKFARPLELGPIPNADFERFVSARFSSAGGKAGADVARRVVESGQGFPYYTQQIAHELFLVSETPSVADVDLAVRNAVEHQAPAFSYVWDSVKSPLQRRYLIGLAKEPQSASGTMFISKYRLKSWSHVERVRKQLEGRGLIDRGAIVDPLFAIWLRSIEKF